MNSPSAEPAAAAASHVPQTAHTNSALSTTPDDLEAVRTIVATLSPFEKSIQLRILKWSREKLGLVEALPVATEKLDAGSHAPAASNVEIGRGAKTIKDFITEKNPSSNNEFAAAVAYFYRFEAPATAQKEAIDSDALQEACRLSGRPRLENPSQTLGNAHNMGYLDKTGDRGFYRISTVGENLVAMTLPNNGSNPSSGQRKRSANGRSTATRRKR